MAKAGGVDILLRAQGADETQQALRQTAKELRDLGRAGGEGAAGMTDVERSLAAARGKVASLAGVTGAGVMPMVPPGAALQIADHAKQADRLQTALNRVGKEGDTAARSLGALGRLGVGGDMAQGANALVSAVGKLGLAVAGISAGAVGIMGLAAAFRSAIGSAAEAEEATLKAASALQATGQYSAAAVRDMQGFASSVQKVSTLSDEAALNLASLIARMTGITGEPLERMTRAAIDLQAALGTNAETVGRIFAQLQAGEMMGLTRLGIRLDESIPKAERLRAGLEAIERTFGGASAAVIEGYTGSVARLRNALDDLGEAIGATFLPRLTGFAQGATAAIENLTHRLMASKIETQATVRELVQMLDTQRAALAGAPEYREAILHGIGQLEKKALVEIGLEINRGDLAEALRTLEALDERIAASGAQRGRLRAQEGALLAAEAISKEIRVQLNARDLEGAKSSLANLRAVVADFPELHLDISAIEGEVRSARRPIDDFLLELRAKADQAIRVRLEAETDEARSEVRAFREELGGKGIEVLVQGTPDFRQAMAELESARQKVAEVKDEIERPATVTVVTDVTKVADEVKAIPGATLEVKLGPITDEEAARAAIEAENKLRAQGAKLSTEITTVYDIKGQPVPVLPGAQVTVELGYKPEDPARAMAEAQAAIAVETGKLEADVRLKIEGAKDAEELSAILEALEAKFARAKAAGEKGDWGAARLAEEYGDATIAAQKLAQVRLGAIRSAEAIAALDELTQSLRSAQSQAEKGLPSPRADAEGFRSLAAAAEEARAAVAAIGEQKTGDAMTAQFRVAQAALAKLAEKYPALRGEVQALRAELEGPTRTQVEIRLEAEKASDQLKGLIALAEKLGDAAGTLDLADKADLALFGQDARAAALSVAEIEEALAKLESGTATVEELRAGVAALAATLGQVDAGNLDIGPQLEARVRGALGNLRGIPGLDKSERQLTDLERKIEATGEALKDFPADAMGDVLGEALSSMLLDAENFAKNMEGLFKSMVDALMRELARLAAYEIIKAILKVASGGSPLGDFPAGPMSYPGKPMAPVEIPAPAVRVATAGPVEPVEITIPLAVTEPEVPEPPKLPVELAPLEQVTLRQPVAIEEPEPIALRQPVAVAPLAAEEVEVPVTLRQPPSQALRVPVSVLGPPRETIALPAPEFRVGAALPIAAPFELLEPAAQALRVPVSVLGPPPQTIQLAPPDFRVPGAAAISLPAPEVEMAAPETRIGMGAVVPPKPAPAPPPAVEGLRLPALSSALAAIAGGARDMAPVTSLIARQVAESRASQGASLALAAGMRSLLPARSLVEEFTPIALRGGARQTAITINAQDAASYERWMRTGAGRRAMEALSNAGAGGF